MSVVRLVLSMAALAVWSAPLCAHDLWLEVAPSSSGPAAVVRYGHPGQFESPAPAKLIEMSATASDLATVELLRGSHAGEHVPTLVLPVSVGGRGALLSASYDNGFWTRAPDGVFRNAPKPMVAGGTDSQWSLKFAKALTGSDAPWDHVVGQELEIVPASAPFGEGPQWRVKVLFKGAPLADAEIKQIKDLEVSDEPVALGHTGADGTLVIPHGSAREYLSTSYQTPSSQPGLADRDVYSATLSVVDARALTH